jgi:hypothetical protein
LFPCTWKLGIFGIGSHSTLSMDVKKILGNWPCFDEIARMEGKNSTDCERTVSEIHIEREISNIF